MMRRAVDGCKVPPVVVLRSSRFCSIRDIIQFPRPRPLVALNRNHPAGCRDRVQVSYFSPDQLLHACSWGWLGWGEWGGVETVVCTTFWWFLNFGFSFVVSDSSRCFALGLIFGLTVFCFIQFFFCFLLSVFALLYTMIDQTGRSVGTCGGLVSAPFNDSIEEITRIVSVLPMSRGKPADLGWFQKGRTGVQNWSLVGSPHSDYFRIQLPVCCRR